MDAKFHPAVEAIKAGDLQRFKELIDNNPALATDRSKKSHPTLLQCLVLDGRNLSNQVGMVRVLVKAGAEINGPLIACASINNVAAAAELLDCGALINGLADWSPLEEALYWGNSEMIEFLLDRDASAHNLRIAAGLGRADLIENFFDQHGNLKPGAGDIHWPFSDPLTSTNTIEIPDQSGRYSSQQDVINNAFLYACMHGQQRAAEALLEKGAEINAIPPGFHYRGTGLHNAAARGQSEMCAFLIQRGADPNARDLENGGTAASWAAYGRHPELSDYLESQAKA